MNIKLLFTLALAAVISLSGCDDRSTCRVHAKHHVHNNTALAVYYVPSTHSFYGFDSSTNNWYSYSPPAGYTPPVDTRSVSTTSSPPVGSAPSISTGYSNAPPAGVSSIERGGFGSTSQEVNGNVTQTAFGLPPGGSWAKTDQVPPSEELVADTETATIVTNPEGEPLTMETVEAENAADTAADAVSDAASDAGGSSFSESESPSSDSGSSSDSGGGGGDSGGGGGD